MYKDKLKYVFEDATKAIIRNKTLSIISIVIRSLILIIIGLFILYLVFVDKNCEEIDCNNGMNSFARGIEVISLIILPPFSLFLVGCENKISIYSRKDEILTKKLLGETNCFIRWTFIIQGVFIGIISAFISIIFLYVLYSLLRDKLLQLELSVILVQPNFIINRMLLLFIGFGILLGIMGSIIALRKVFFEKIE